MRLHPTLIISGYFLKPSASRSWQRIGAKLAFLQRPQQHSQIFQIIAKVAPWRI